MNPIDQWITEDKVLADLLTEIESQANSVEEMAELAFERLCDVYPIPKMPEDELPENPDNESEDDTPLKRSLFTEHALLRFLSDKNADPRSLVLTSAWHILNDYGVDLEQVAMKEYGNNIPAECQIAIRGNGIYGEVVFPDKEGKSWIELGCIEKYILLSLKPT